MVLSLSDFHTWKLYMDHSKKACVTALRVTKVHLDCCFARKLVFFFFIVRILKRKHEKDLQLVWGKVQYCLQKQVFIEVFKLFLPKGRS